MFFGNLHFEASFFIIIWFKSLDEETVKPLSIHCFGGQSDLGSRSKLTLAPVASKIFDVGRRFLCHKVWRFRNNVLLLQRETISG